MVERNALGDKLRTLRKARKISGIELASLVGVSQSNISRIEAGLLRPDLEYVRKFVSVAQLGRREASELVEFAENFLVDFDRWRSGSPGVISRLQTLVRRREERASVIQGYSSDFLPGLLQIPSYIDALFMSLGELNLKSRKIAVTRRLARQDVLKKQSKIFQSVILESALRIVMGSERIMRDQRQYLRPWLFGKNGYELKIIPFTAALKSFPVNGFSVYDKKFVALETMTRGINIWSEDEVKDYCQLFDSLYSNALGGSDAEELLMGIK